MTDIHALLKPIRELHERIRQAVVENCERATLEQLAGIVADDEGDTIYAVDRVSERLLIDFFAREVGNGHVAGWASTSRCAGTLDRR